MIERRSHKTRGPFISCLSECGVWGKTGRCHGDGHKLPNKKTTTPGCEGSGGTPRRCLAGSVLFRLVSFHLHQQCDLQLIPLRPRRDPDKRDCTRICAWVHRGAECVFANQRAGCAQRRRNTHARERTQTLTHTHTKLRKTQMNVDKKAAF